jgi:hypothetical protein
MLRVLGLIAMGTRDHDVLGTVTSTQHQRRNMVGVIVLADLLVTVEALAGLTFVLNLNIVSGVCSAITHLKGAPFLVASAERFPMGKVVLMLIARYGFGVLCLIGATPCPRLLTMGCAISAKVCGILFTMRRLIQSPASTTATLTFGTEPGFNRSPANKELRGGW